MPFPGQENHLATIYTPLIELWWVGESLHAASPWVHASPNQSSSHHSPIKSYKSSLWPHLDHCFLSHSLLCFEKENEIFFFTSFSPIHLKLMHWNINILKQKKKMALSSNLLKSLCLKNYWVVIAILVQTCCLC